MKKCDIFSDCMCDRHLVMNLDLRVDLENRLAEVSRVVVPLKERIGGLSVSVNLTYQENGVSKYCNLPVYVTEDEQERVIKVSFPADLRVTIWTDGVEKAIHGLEYHVNKHTEVVTEVVTDVNTFQPTPGRIQLSILVKDITEEQGLNSDTILSSLTAQAQRIRDWNQPIDLVLEQKPGRSYLMAEILEVQRQYVASQLKLTIRARRPNNLIPTIGTEIMELSITVGNEGVLEVGFLEKSAFLPNLIFLYEDDNGLISNLDQDGSWTAPVNWEWFASELQAEQYPAVYLRSPNSGGYCPVNYQVFRDEANVVNGVLMEISYYREVDGHLELWTEQRNFDGLPIISSSYAGGQGEPLKIRKVILGTIQ